MTHLFDFTLVLLVAMMSFNGLVPEVPPSAPPNIAGVTPRTATSGVAVIGELLNPRSLVCHDIHLLQYVVYPLSFLPNESIICENFTIQ